MRKDRMWLLVFLTIPAIYLGSWLYYQLWPEQRFRPSPPISDEEIKREADEIVRDILKEQPPLTPVGTPNSSERSAN